MNFLILSLFLLPIATPVPTPTRPPVVQEITALDPLVNMVNKVREESGCKIPLKENIGLINAAKERADFVSSGHWYHDGWKKTVSKYYRYSSAGENLARDYSNDRQILDAWLGSKTHRAVLLNCSYRETGIGRNGTYTVQLFGKK
jgi:uncharacterized protein YkwD